MTLITNMEELGRLHDKCVDVEYMKLENKWEIVADENCTIENVAVWARSRMLRVKLQHVTLYEFRENKSDYLAWAAHSKDIKGFYLTGRTMTGEIK